MSDYKYEEASALDAAAALSIGNALRNAREARGETLLDVAHSLKLAPKQVEALELERFDLLPGRAFVRGFLRNYARHLGLDGDRLVGRLADSSAGTAPSVDLSPPKNARGTLPTGSAAPAKAPRSILAFIVLMAMALGLGWYFDWFKISEVGRLGAEREPARPLVSEPAVVAPFVTPPQRVAEPLAAIENAGRAPVAPVERAPSPAPAGDTTATAPLAGAAVVSQPVPSPAAPSPVPAAAVADQSLKQAEPAATVVEGAATSNTPAPGAEPVPSTPEVAAREPGQLLFRLRGESWIQVRDASGNTIYMGTGAAGSTRIVQGTPPFAVVVGNATQVVMEHAGKAIDLTPHIRTGVARLTVE